MEARLPRDDADRVTFQMFGRQHATELAAHLPFDPERWDRLFDDYLTGANPTIWFAESATGWKLGYAMASLVPHLAADVNVAQLNFLYVQPRVRRTLAGGRAALLLMAEFEAWADRVGAAESCVGVSTPYRAESTERLYESFGYHPVVAMTKRRGR